MRAKLIASLIIILLTPAFISNAKIYVVSAGISDYPGTINDVLNPAKGANAIAWFYSKNFDADYLLLTNKNATGENIVNGIKQKLSNAKPEDMVVFYYSGHGYEGGICAYDRNVSYDEIRKAMAKSKSKNKIMFVDACHTGSARTPSKSNFKVPKEETGNVLLFLSSRAKESSMDSSLYDSPVFTNFLMEGLKGKADANHDRTVTANELFKYVRLKVDEGKFGQSPVMWGKFPDDMPIVVLK